MKNAMAPQSDNEDDYSKISMKQSNSYGNLMESRAHGSNFNVDTTTMKRNKSFWRFSKSEDILMEGMALWKHHDLVPIDGEFLERPPSMIINRIEDNNATLKKQDKNKKTSTLQTKPDKALSQSAKKSEKNKSSSTRNTSEKKSAIVEPSKHTDTMVSYKDPLNKYEDYDENDIYDESPKKRNDIGPTSTMPKRSMQQPPPAKPVYGDRKKNFHRDSSLQETNFYEDDVFVMKTVKRKEILKQYYSSGTDTELSSSDPYDPYDCIAITVDDHQLSQAQSTLRNNRNSYAAETSESLAKAYQQQRQQQQRASKTESLSGTLLPRTKLSKSVRSETNDFDFSDRISTTRSNKIASKEKWTNLWSE